MHQTLPGRFFRESRKSVGLCVCGLGVVKKRCQHSVKHESRKQEQSLKNIQNWSQLPPKSSQNDPKSIKMHPCVANDAEVGLRACPAGKQRGKDRLFERKSCSQGSFGEPPKTRKCLKNRLGAYRSAPVTSKNALRGGF
jgi:hypothetical protein